MKRIAMKTKNAPILVFLEGKIWLQISTFVFLSIYISFYEVNNGYIYCFL